MTFLLRLFLMIALVTTQGSVMAQALCRHQNAQEHVLARASHDLKVASVSLREDAAAVAVSKKASQSGDSSSHWPAEMLPADSEAPMLPAVERVRLKPGLQSALRSTTSPPLLKPPSA